MKNRTRRYIGILVHYLRNYQANGATIFVSLAMFYFSGRIWREEIAGYVRIGDANALEFFMNRIFGLSLGLPIFLIPMFMSVFFHRKQRQEMLNILAWPAEQGHFAMMKLLDAHSVVLYIFSALLPAWLMIHGDCKTESETTLAMFLIALCVCGIIAAYFLSGLFAVLLGPAYIRLFPGKARFTFFQVVWVLIGIGIPSLYYMPATAQYVHAACDACANVLRMALAAGPAGMLAGFAISGVCLVILAYVAHKAVGSYYVGMIQELEDTIALAQKPVSGHDGMIALNYLPLLPKPVQTIWAKDLRLILRHQTMAFTIAFWGLIIVVGGVLSEADQLLELGLAHIIVTAVIGATMFQFSSLRLFAFEGTACEGIASYPVYAQHVLLGKTLCAITIQLPLIVFFLAALVKSDFAADRICEFVFWLCWLFPLSLSQIVLGGVLKLEEDITLAGGSKEAASMFITIFVDVAFVIFFFAVYFIASTFSSVLLLLGACGFILTYAAIAKMSVSSLPGLRVWAGK